MPEPRNLRNDVLPQLLQRHVVGDQRLIRIAGELHRRQPRVPIRRNHRRDRDGVIEVASPTDANDRACALVPAYAKVCTITGPAIAVAGPARSGVKFCSIHARARLFDSSAPA